jgi:retron-type reverse transcriptase
LERQRTLTVNILEKIVDYGNVNKAYQQVRVNSGSGGVDGMDVLELRQWIGKNYRKFCEEILNGSYEASPVRKVEIQKGNGGTRILGIPTVKDRLIQQAISQEPILRPLL